MNYSPWWIVAWQLAPILLLGFWCAKQRAVIRKLAERATFYRRRAESTERIALAVADAWLQTSRDTATNETFKEFADGMDSVVQWADVVRTERAEGAKLP